MAVISNSIIHDTLTSEAYKAVKGYFDNLTALGYLRYDNVAKLILFTHIEEILYSGFFFEASEKDYEVMSNTLNCLYKICLIPYSEYLDSIPYVGGQKDTGVIRRTHNPVLRHTEDGNYRTIEPRTKLIG